MKNLLKIITILTISFFTFWTINVNAWIDLSSVEWVNNITKHSLWGIENSWDITNDIKSLWFSILTIIKYIVSWLLVILLVYVGVEMIMSMWNDEDRLSKSKRQLRYILVWLIFINIPWSLYKIFEKNSNSTIDWSINWTWANQVGNNISIFINTTLYEKTINSWIILFIESALSVIAIFVILLAGINIMISRWREDEVTEAKNKITWSIIWLIFIWFIEGWKKIVYNGDVSDWANLFHTMEELALFFAWPVAIFFLTLAWYYYITSNGEEDRVKKAKSIVINTFIATLILLASHAILKDLITL